MRNKLLKMDLTHQGNPLTISESKTIEDFGNSLGLNQGFVKDLRSVILDVLDGNIGDIGKVKYVKIKDLELGDIKIFLEKLFKTGFLD